MSRPIIRFGDVHKSFRGVRALDGLSFSVPESGCLGLLGPNGAGKTTAIKALLGLVKVDRGEIENRARRIGYVPQQPALFGWMTAGENLHFVARSVGLTGASEAVDEWLERVGILNAKDRRASGLSGGMRQRLALAMAMIQDPDVLVLDEPVSAMDPIGRYEILRLIAGLKQERAIIMSTHILDDAERVCDSIVIMNNGAALLQQDTEALQAELTPHFEIQLSAESQAVEELEQHLLMQPWVTHVQVQGPTLSLVLAQGPADIPRLIHLLGEEGLQQIERFERSKPTLESIFLQVVRNP